MQKIPKRRTVYVSATYEEKAIIINASVSYPSLLYWKASVD
jgi:hypothetical protein